MKADTGQILIGNDPMNWLFLRYIVVLKINKDFWIDIGNREQV